MTMREDNLVELSYIIPNVSDSIALQRLARMLYRSYEQDCNGYGDDQAQARAEKRQARLEAEAREIAQRYSLTLYVQTDPRGWPLYLLTSDQITNIVVAGGTLDGHYDIGRAVYPH